MPLIPAGTEDRKRAESRATIELKADRVVLERARTNREKLLVQLDVWLAENFRITVQEILFGGQFEAEDICEILVSHGKDLFQAGRSYNKFAETINAISVKRPQLRKQLAPVWDLAFNWVIQEPHEHHAALPISILLAISSLCLLWGWVREACIFLVTWSGLMRIGEILNATRAHLVLPRDAEPGFRSLLVKIMQPKTRGRSAKHQIAKVDFPDVIDLCDATYGKVSPSEKLWHLSPQTLRSRFRQVQQALGLDVHRSCNHVPYDLGSLRAGGATFMLAQTEDSEYVRRKGRWLSSRVLEIYLQEASVSTYKSRLSEESRNKVEALAGRFQEIVQKAILNLHASIPPSAWSRLW